MKLRHQQSPLQQAPEEIVELSQCWSGRAAGRDPTSCANIGDKTVQITLWIFLWRVKHMQYQSCINKHPLCGVARDGRRFCWAGGYQQSSDRGVRGCQYCLLQPILTSKSQATGEQMPLHHGNGKIHNNTCWRANFCFVNSSDSSQPKYFRLSVCNVWKSSCNELRPH